MATIYRSLDGDKVVIEHKGFRGEFHSLLIKKLNRLEVRIRLSVINPASLQDSLMEIGSIRCGVDDLDISSYGLSKRKYDDITIITAKK